MEEVHTSDPHDKKGPMTPLPRAQIISVIMIQLSEAINSTSLRPSMYYINLNQTD